MAASDTRGRPRRSRSAEWLTVRDIAGLLHVSDGTVRRWIRAEGMEAKFFGGRTGYRVRRSDLEAFLNRGTGHYAAEQTSTG